MAQAGYKYLKSYQLSVIIYDLTVEFVRRWIDYKSRTKDQMEQAARSGKQKAQFLLAKQGTALEEKFVREGGYSENLFKRRLEEKKKK